MAETKVPEIRFEGFDEPQAGEILGERATFTKGQGYSKSDVRGSGTPLFLYGRIYTDFQLTVRNVDTFAELQPGAKLSTGREVLVPSSGETSEEIATAVALLQPGVIIASDLNVVRPGHGLDPVYLALALGNGVVKEELARRAQGKSVVHLRNSDLFNLVLNVPTIENEQKLVGALFSELDSLIAGHRKKLAKLQQTKTSLLQKMFPQGDADEPELRVEGFTGAWASRDLGELGRARSGVGFPDAEQGGHSGIPFFKVSDMNLPGNEGEMLRSNNYVSHEQVEHRKWRPIYDVPAIIFAKVGAAVLLGRKRFATEPFLADNNMIGYSLDLAQWDSSFARVMFETLDFSSLVQVGALPSFNSSAVERMSVKVPAQREEQQAIGALFSELDDVIVGEQQYIEKLKQAKTSLLQKMFV